MDRNRYESLPEKARAVLDANSTCEVTREMGVKVDKWEADSRDYVAAKGDHTFTQIDTAELDAMRNKLGENINASFAERVPNGAAILEQWVAAMDAARLETGETTQ